MQDVILIVTYCKSRLPCPEAPSWALADYMTVALPSFIKQSSLPRGNPYQAPLSNTGYETKCSTCTLCIVRYGAVILQLGNACNSFSDYAFIGWRWRCWILKTCVKPVRVTNPSYNLAPLLYPLFIFLIRIAWKQCNTKCQWPRGIVILVCPCIVVVGGWVKRPE